MARRVAPKTYLYRQHTLTYSGDGWTITGPAVKTETFTIRTAMQLIDQTPGTPRKMTRKERGRLGAKAWHAKYRMEPVNLNDFAIVERATGKIVNYINGIGRNP